MKKCISCTKKFDVYPDVELCANCGEARDELRD